MKKIPMRRCLVLNESFPKNELFRIVRNNDGVFLDMSSKMNGRGAYINKSLEAIEKAQKTKVLDKALGVPVNDEIYERMKLYLSMK